MDEINSHYPVRVVHFASTTCPNQTRRALNLLELRCDLKTKVFSWGGGRGGGRGGKTEGSG